MAQADIQNLKEIMEECIESTNASDADLEMMRSYQIPETREAKCLLACVQKGVGTVGRSSNSIFCHFNFWETNESFFSSIV